MVLAGKTTLETWIWIRIGVRFWMTFSIHTSLRNSCSRNQPTRQTFLSLVRAQFHSFERMIETEDMKTLYSTQITKATVYCAGFDVYVPKNVRRNCMRGNCFSIEVSHYYDQDIFFCHWPGTNFSPRFVYRDVLHYMWTQMKPMSSKLAVGWPPRSVNSVVL